MSYRPLRSAYAVAAAALLGSTALAAPAIAQTQPRQQTQVGAASTGATTAKPTKARDRGDIVERRLATLHKQLKITPQQEDRWNAFAQTVRDNEARMKDLVVSRHQTRNASAVDDLRNYGDITEEHANSIKRLMAPFQDLYGTMDDAQKRNADRVFARYEGRGETRESGQRPAAKPKS